MKNVLLFLLVGASLIFMGCDGNDQKNDENDNPDNDMSEESEDDKETAIDPDLVPDEDAGEDADVVFEFDVQRVFDDVAWLSSADRTGRQPGTPGNDAAVEYVRGVFNELGLTPAGDDGTFFQAFDFDLWEIQGTPALSIDGSSIAAGTGFQVMQYSGKGSAEKEMVFAGHGMTVPPFDTEAYPDCPLPATGYDDFAGVDVNGKIVVMIRRGPDNLEAIHSSCPANEACLAEPCLWNFGYKSKNAALHGAAGVIFVNHYQDSGDIPEGVTLGLEYYVDDLPVVFALRSDVEKALPDMPAWSEAIDADIKPHSIATGVTANINVDVELKNISADNVVGVLPGTDPELSSEVIVIGAHIDHLGTDALSKDVFAGADDNATGTAVVMELARAFVLGGHKTARTVVFAAWNAEELGLLGSCHYVEDPSFPMSNTVAAYSIDMVGAGQGIGLGLYGATLPENAWMADVMTGYAKELSLDFEVMPAEPLDASDHVCFYYNGSVPAILLSTLGNHDFYHTPQDTIDTILPEDLESAVWLSWAGIYPIAMGIEDLYNGTPVLKSAQNESLLSYPQRYK